MFMFTQEPALIVYKDKLRSDFETFESETDFVLLHVGTNSLQRGLWELDAKHFVTLYKSVKEVFRCAKIICFKYFTSLGR